MITPEPPAGSEHYREGWRHGYEQAAIDRERSADAVRLVPATLNSELKVGAVPDTGQAREPGAALDAAHFARQAAWSARTFGPGPRTAGVLDHIRKELGEIEADPSDLGEWVDVMILAADGAWRAGHGPQEIVDAVIAKQARNEARVWPDWRTAEPGKAIEHDRSASGDTGQAREPSPYLKPGEPLTDAFQAVETYLGYRIPAGYVADILIGLAQHEHADRIRKAFARVRSADTVQAPDVAALGDVIVSVIAASEHATLVGAHARRQLADRIATAVSDPDVLRALLGTDTTPDVGRG